MRPRPVPPIRFERRPLYALVLEESVPTRPLASSSVSAALRLAALMKLPVVYGYTHASVAVGEDGPTHQPVEQISALRTIPGLDVVRPADANGALRCGSGSSNTRRDPRPWSCRDRTFPC
ncbi:MAG: hypothetical protein ACTHU1_14015 [Arachnia sp.]